MFDIHFYQNIYRLKQELMLHGAMDYEQMWESFESCRSREPAVYNIETTNACNMRCEMCPRTTMMTRPVSTMEDAVYERVIKQLRPFTESEWSAWEAFVEDKYDPS